MRRATNSITFCTWDLPASLVPQAPPALAGCNEDGQPGVQFLKRVAVLLEVPGIQVAPISGLRYRRLTVGRAPAPAIRLDFCNVPRHTNISCRSQTGDSADRRSALQVAFVTGSFNRIPRVYGTAWLACSRKWQA